MRFNFSFFSLLCLAVVFVVITTTFTDFEWKIISDQAVVILILVGIFFSFFNPFLIADSFFEKFKESLVGLAVGVLVPGSIAYLGKLFFGQDVIGLGDVKLAAGYGAVFGVAGLSSIFFWAIVFGGCFSTVGLVFKFLKRRQYIAFGPFINAGVLVTMFQYLVKLNN